MPRLRIWAERAGFDLTLRIPRQVPEEASSSIRQIQVEEILFLRGQGQ